jgi:hypothetical protein
MQSERIQQLSVFLENRMLELASIERKLAERDIPIHAMSLLSAADHAVLRLVVPRPAVAQLELEAGGYKVFRSSLLGVALSAAGEPEIGIRPVLSALIAAEVRVEYVYSLIVPVAGRPVLALNVNDVHVAARALKNMGLTLVSQEQLESPLP